MSFKKFSTDLDEYEVFDARSLEYLKHITDTVVSTRGRLQEALKELEDPRNSHKLILYLEREGKVDVKISESLRKLRLFALKYLRVIESEKAKKEGKTYPAALAKYRSAVHELLAKAGLTNERELLKSFLAKVETAMSRKKEEEKSSEEYIK